MASNSQEKDVSDIADAWVRKLRCRFTQLGLSSSTSGTSESNYLPPHSNKDVKNTRYYQESETRPYFEKRKQDFTPNRDSASIADPEELGKFEETSNGVFRIANDSRKTMVSTTSILEQEYSQEKLSVNQNGYKCNEELLHSNEHPKFLERLENRVQETTVSNAFSEKSETSEEFYVRPSSVSSTSSWEKYNWRSDKSGVITPELNESPKLGSSSENVEIMLDWWG